MDQLEILKQLQGIDGELFKLRRQQREKPRELQRLIEQVAAQEALAKAAEEAHRALQVSQREKEIELQTREAAVKRLQSQLFQVKTNKEYAAMQREIESSRTDNSLLEETILKLFDGIEQAGRKRQEEQRRLTQEQESLRVERERIEQELAQMAEQVAQLEQTRQAVTPNLAAGTLETYERVLQNREGLALVALMHGACGGCHRRLPPQVVNEVLLKARLVTCESCNRILYCDEAHSEL